MLNFFLIRINSLTHFSIPYAYCRTGMTLIISISLYIFIHAELIASTNKALPLPLLGKP